MTDTDLKKNKEYHDKITIAVEAFDYNLNQRTRCYHAIDKLKKAREGINFMVNTQIPYTVSSSEKAFHFNSYYYDILKLRNDDYVERINSIIKKVEADLDVLEIESRRLSNEIEYYRNKVWELRKSYGV